MHSSPHLSRKNSGEGGAPVIFQEVVHSIETEEAVKPAKRKASCRMLPSTGQ